MVSSISGCIFNSGSLLPRSGLPQDIIGKLEDIEYWVGIKSTTYMRDTLECRDYLVIITDMDDEIKYKI